MKKIFLIFLLFVSKSLLGQKAVINYHIDASIANDSIVYNSFDNYKGLIFLIPKHVKLDIGNLSKDIRVNCFKKNELNKVEDFFRKNKIGIFLLVNIDIKSLKERESAVFKYTTYESGDNLFNIKPIWGKYNNKIMGLPISKNEVYLKYFLSENIWR